MMGRSAALLTLLMSILCNNEAINVRDANEAIDGRTRLRRRNFAKADLDAARALRKLQKGVKSKEEVWGSAARPRGRMVLAHCCCRPRASSCLPVVGGPRAHRLQPLLLPCGWRSSGSSAASSFGPPVVGGLLPQGLGLETILIDKNQ